MSHILLTELRSKQKKFTRIRRVKGYVLGRKLSKPLHNIIYTDDSPIFNDGKYPSN